MKTVFTNGCFDLLHPGHVDFLERARALGDRLVVGINSDRSVRQIKGPERPIQSEEDRRAVLSALRPVDEVRIFDEATPERLISEIKPAVLVKGADWGSGEIVGADFVRQHGGEVVVLPLLNGYSTTATIERLTSRKGSAEMDVSTKPADSIVRAAFEEHAETVRAFSDGFYESVKSCGEAIIETLRSGKKVLLCGNGGSAADAQHLAAEFVGRYETERTPLPAIALTTDTSALTAISNDYGIEKLFERQVGALANGGDLLIAISTSGNSPNVIAAVMEARRKGCKVIGMTGEGGRKLASLTDLNIMVPSRRTSRIQEIHIITGHIWCEMVDAAISTFEPRPH